MGCLNPAEIELLLHSDSTGTTVQAFREHVEHCPTCQARVKEVEANEELLGEMKGIFPNGILPSSGNEPPSGSSKDVVPFLTGKNQRVKVSSQLGRIGSLFSNELLFTTKARIP